MISELAESVVSKLTVRHLKIATAESCTGGMISQFITSVEGSSKIFEYGVVAYADRVKAEELSVSEQSLENYGAVSEQVCVEMAEGVMTKAKADIGIAVTGIAGPGGGTAEKPVGTVHIAVCTKKQIRHKLLKLSGDRRDVRESTTKNVLNLLKEVIDTVY